MCVNRENTVTREESLDQNKVSLFIDGATKYKTSTGNQVSVS